MNDAVKGPIAIEFPDFDEAKAVWDGERVAVSGTETPRCLRPPLGRQGADPTDPVMLVALEAVREFGSGGTTDDGISVSYLVEEAIKEAPVPR